VKSSSGQYFIGLDHVRAVAVFIVFAYHFVHVNNLHKGPPPFFPLSILTEGHTGVALFMTLSGYLFAKLLDGKRIRYPAFIYNRAIRLLPLLSVALLIGGLELAYWGVDLGKYARSIAWGWLKPSLPNGGWSITAEFHFYLLLPIILLLARKQAYALFAVVVAALLLRAGLYWRDGSVQGLAYFTIIGRIDQFVLGIAAYRFRHVLAGRHVLAAFAALLFAIFFWYFDTLGGFYGNQGFPSASAVWILVPFVEGLAFAVLVGWYDNSFRHPLGKVSRFIALIGACSYSIYLLHFFVVFRLANGIHRNFIDLSNVYVALLVSVLGFLVFFPFAWLSYRFIELPLLAFRTRYLVDAHSPAAIAARDVRRCSANLP